MNSSCSDFLDGYDRIQNMHILGCHPSCTADAAPPGPDNLINYADLDLELSRRQYTGLFTIEIPLYDCSSKKELEAFYAILPQAQEDEISLGRRLARYIVTYYRGVFPRLLGSA